MTSIKRLQAATPPHNPSALQQSSQVRLTDLPSELVAQILGHTSGGLVLQLASCGKVFRDVARNNPVWKQLRDKGQWRPSAGVVDIIKAGADRDAYRVQVMERKLLWDKLGAQIQTLDNDYRKLAFQAPVGRGGCTLGAPMTSLRAGALAKAIHQVETRRANLTSELKNDYLAITDKGWKRQWG